MKSMGRRYPDPGHSGQPILGTPGASTSPRDDTHPDQGSAKHLAGDLVPHGLDEATTNANVIAQWWAAHPQANLGEPRGGSTPPLATDLSVRAIAETSCTRPASGLLLALIRCE